MPNELVLSTPSLSDYLGRPVTVTNRETVSEEAPDEAVLQRILSALAVVKALPDRPAEIELVGAWIWLSFKDKPTDATRAALQAASFRWSPKKERWYFAGVPTGNRRGRFSMDDIRARHGSVPLR